ncbi:acyl-[acyl-carrier-protein] thioesterase [Hoyosella altamirensis]|uniref:Acyl-ACP thioesterase n=1 Tax=Hoyosella altamirensis TaxID=616997 RepID=A0A839RMD5_9ACTN|nr:acyl-ACP thioesterase domain-containing protein [Hoyosella altamirensis]MBB3037670.1 acyl-ACP thioesterase [Hoyosella altamirensis]
MLDTPLMPLPHDGHVFTTNWPMRAGDVDKNWRLRLDGIARYLQDAGFDHLDAVDARAEHPAWVVRRSVIDVIQPPEFPSLVHINRWCSGLSSRWCSMRVRMTTDDGGLVETEGFWINFNAETLRPARITDRFEKLLSGTALTSRLRWQQWISDSPGPDDAVTPFPLRSTDIDVMAHVNNAMYLQAVDAALRTRPELHEVPTRTVIEYLVPIAPDDDVLLRTRHGEKDLTIWFTVGGKVHAQAMVLPLH